MVCLLPFYRGNWQGDIWDIFNFDFSWDIYVTAYRASPAWVVFARNNYLCLVWDSSNINVQAEHDTRKSIFCWRYWRNLSDSWLQIQRLAGWTTWRNDAYRSDLLHWRNLQKGVHCSQFCRVHQWFSTDSNTLSTLSNLSWTIVY